MTNEAQQTGLSIKEHPILLEAVLNIRNINTLHELLLKAFESRETIEIDASAVTSIDTATLQLLTVLKQEGVKSGKKVVFDFPSDKFIETARLLGLADLLEVEHPQSGLF
jgi:Anti-anti-sigma regulatory factor (antagonist of anti-sigma factor)